MTLYSYQVISFHVLLTSLLILGTRFFYHWFGNLGHWWGFISCNPLAMVDACVVRDNSMLLIITSHKYILLSFYYIQLLNFPFLIFWTYKNIDTVIAVISVYILLEKFQPQILGVTKTVHSPRLLSLSECSVIVLVWYW